MAYAILRFAKKKIGGITAAYAHNERKKEIYKSNPDIDANRKTENYHLVLPKQTYRREVVRLINAAASLPVERTASQAGTAFAENLARSLGTAKNQRKAGA